MTPNGINVEHLTAIIDTREQLPLDLSPMKMEKDGLKTGDYSIKGLEKYISVERKSLPDLLQCIGGERERFEREIQRLILMDYSCIVVEASWDDIFEHRFQSEISVNSVVGSIIGWTRVIPINMTVNRHFTEMFVSNYLRLCAKKILLKSWPLYRELGLHGIINVKQLKKHS